MTRTRVALLVGEPDDFDLLAVSGNPDLVADVARQLLTVREAQQRHERAQLAELRKLARPRTAA
jgi:hypothetical protein